jgi:hypothetical protein
LISWPVFRVWAPWGIDLYNQGVGVKVGFVAYLSIPFPMILSFSRWSAWLCLLVSTVSVCSYGELIRPDGDENRYASFEKYQASIAQSLPEYFDMVRLEILSTTPISTGLFAKTESECTVFLRTKIDLYEQIGQKGSKASVVLNTPEGTEFSLSIRVATEFMPGSVAVRVLSSVGFNAYPLERWDRQGYVIQSAQNNGVPLLEDPLFIPFYDLLQTLLKDQQRGLLGFVGKPGEELSLDPGKPNYLFEWQSLELGPNGSLTGLRKLFDGSEAIAFEAQPTIRFVRKQRTLVFDYHDAEGGQKQYAFDANQSLLYQLTQENREVFVLDLETQQQIGDVLTSLLQADEQLHQGWDSLMASGKDYVWIDDILFDVESMQPVPGNWSRFSIAAIEGSGGRYVAIETDNFDDPGLSARASVKISDVLLGVCDRPSDLVTGTLSLRDNQIQFVKDGYPWDELLSSSPTSFWVRNTLKQVVYIRDGDIWTAEIDWPGNGLRKHKQVTRLGNIAQLQLLAWIDDKVYFKNNRSDDKNTFVLNLKNGVGEDVVWSLPTEGFLSPTGKFLLKTVPQDFHDLAYTTNINLGPASDFKDTPGQHTLEFKRDNRILARYRPDNKLIEITDLETRDSYYLPIMWADKSSRAWAPTRDLKEALWLDSQTFLLGNQVVDISRRGYVDLTVVKPGFAHAFWQDLRNSPPRYYPDWNFIEGSGAQLFLETGEARIAEIDYPIQAWISSDEYLYVIEDGSITKRGIWVGNIATGEQKLITRATPFYTFAEKQFKEVSVRGRQSRPSLLVTRSSTFVLFYAKRGESVNLHVLNTSDWSERVYQTEKPSSDRYIRRFELANFIPRSIHFSGGGDALWMGSGFSQDGNLYLSMDVCADTQLIWPTDSQSDELKKAGFIRAYSLLHILRNWFRDEESLANNTDKEIQELQDYLDHPDSIERFIEWWYDNSSQKDPRVSGMDVRLAYTQFKKNKDIYEMRYGKLQPEMVAFYDQIPELYQQFLKRRKELYDSHLKELRERHEILRSFLSIVSSREKRDSFFQFYQNAFIRSFDTLDPLPDKGVVRGGSTGVEQTIDDMQVIRNWMAKQNQS